jgi:WD40 repeat protein
MSAPSPEAVAGLAAARRTPYQGLVPYSESDADWFFGRDEWCEVIADHLRAYRITVLYGTSGVGKSSVLRAGLLRRLSDEARSNVADYGAPRLLPVVFSAWSLDDPMAAMKEAIASAVSEFSPEHALDPPSGPLTGVLEVWPARIEGPVLVVLDQFEELFLYHGRTGDFALDELAAALRRRDPAVHFLISIREDSLALLDRFKGHVPGLLDHLLRIDHLDRDAAQEAIELPLIRWNSLVAAPGAEVEPEPALVEAVLDQVTAGRVSLAEAGTSAAAPPAEQGIVAPYLQLVLARLWDEERRDWDAATGDGTRVLRLATLNRLGGADRIVRTHLDAALAALPSHEQDVAGKVFRHLVTPSGTKIALRIVDLAGYAHVPEGEIEPLVSRLTGDVRILRGAGEGRYEIYHDALAGPILDWHARWEERQRQRRERRRLAALVAIALVLAGIVALIAVFAISARQAQHRAQRALRVESRTLAGQALSAAADDPPTALQDATQAVGASETKEALGALRAAIASYVRPTPLKGHTDAAWSAAFSPDGKLLVTGGDDDVARIWNVASGTRVLTLAGHKDSVWSTAFSPDGKLVVTAGADGTARLWDVAHGKLRHTLRGHNGAVSSAAFSPDGRLLVTTGADGTVRLWNVATGRALHVFRGHTNYVSAAAFSPDGRLVVSAGDDGTARLWDTQSGRAESFLRISAGAVGTAAFSPNGRYVVVGGANGAAQIWDVRRRRVHALKGHIAAVNAAAFSPDGRLVVTASADRTARIWDVATHKQLHVLEGHTGPVRVAAFSPDGTLVLTASDDGTARVWSVATGASLHTLIGPIGSVNAAAFSPDGTRVATASADGSVRIWPIAGGRRLRELPGRADGSRSAAFSPNGTLAVAVGDDGVARIWDAIDERVFRTLKGNGVITAAYSPDGKRIVTAGVDGRARIWDSAGLDVLQTLGARAAPLRSATFSPDGKLVVTVGADRAARIWSASDGRALRTLRGRGAVNAAAVSPDGKLVVTADTDSLARIWNLASGRVVRRLPIESGALSSVVFSPDGTLVATGAADGTVRLWDAGKGEPLASFEGHTGAVSSVAFSSDGRFLVTASADGTARVWDVTTGRALHVMSSFSGPVKSAAFSPDGRLVITAGAGSGAWIWTSCNICALTPKQLRSLAGDLKKRLFLAGIRPPARAMSACDRATTPLDHRQLRAAAASDPVVGRTPAGRLFGFGKGRFRTCGRFSGATVRG